MDESPAIVAALSWYREPPEALRRTVRSLEGVADALVAADGPWRLFATAPVRSSDEEWEAVRGAAAEAGVALDMPSPRLWATQWSKRAYLMSWAATVALGERDLWILVLDADELVLRADPGLAEFLAAAAEDVAFVSGQLTGRPGDFSRWRRLFRARPRGGRLSVSEAHNGYCVVPDRGGRVRWLAGDPRRELESAADASGLLVLGHDESLRSEERRKASKAHYVRRSRSDER